MHRGKHNVCGGIKMSSTTIDLKRLGRNIKQAREYAQMNQKDLATFLGVDQSLISKYESGERAISANALDKLSILLCFSVHDLLQSECINPRGEVAFRTEGLSYEDNCILASVNAIILNQIEMDGMLYGEN